MNLRPKELLEDSAHVFIRHRSFDYTGKGLTVCLVPVLFVGRVK